MADAYSEPALRHSADADHLAKSSHWDGAGYLIGLAAECAIKYAIAATRPAAGVPHIHLPALVESARRALRGRRTHAIFSVLEQVEFMHGWSIDVRYADDGAVVAEQYKRWRTDANRAMAAAGLKRRMS